MVNQETIKSGLDVLERKILMLLNERKTLQEEVVHMKSECKRVKDDIQYQKEIITDLKQRIQVGAIANHIHGDDTDKTALKKKLDSYIAEIDRCIAHLNT